MTSSRLLGLLALIGALMGPFAPPIPAAPNAPGPITGLGAKTNSPARGIGNNAKTNAAGLRGPRAITNAAPATLSSTNRSQRLVEQFRHWQSSPRYYPVLIGVAICLALLFLARGLKSKARDNDKALVSPVSSKLSLKSSSQLRRDDSFPQRSGDWTSGAACLAV